MQEGFHRMSAQPLAFNVLANRTEAICTLDCEYCFFRSKDGLYPNARHPDEIMQMSGMPAEAPAR
jgi:sulfatase maturation enzyme AslB (radical SAM superfamily)